MAKLYGRSNEMDFVRLEGLQKLTATAAHDWDIYIFKELIDNALDADEADPDIYKPRVEAEVRYHKTGFSITVANQSIFPVKKLDQIFNLRKRVSVKDYYMFPTRGAQGNGLKTILGIPYALYNFYSGGYSVNWKSIVIEVGYQQTSVDFQIDAALEDIEVRIEQGRLPYETEGTEITVNVEAFTRKYPRTAEELLRFSRLIARFNPHSDFEFNFVFAAASDQIEEHNLTIEGDITLFNKYNLEKLPPIQWYTPRKVSELINALIRYHRTEHNNFPTMADVAREFGFDEFPRDSLYHAGESLKTIMRGNSMNQMDATRISEWLCDQPERQLGTSWFVGEDYYHRVLEPVKREHGNGDLFFYDFYQSTNHNPPFVIEVVLSGNAKAQREIDVGINHTLAYRDPFFNRLLYPVDKSEPVKGLDKLLNYYGLQDTSPITLSVHIISPNVLYDNYGKSGITNEEFHQPLVMMIEKLVKQYQEAIKVPEPKDYIQEPARQLLPDLLMRFQQQGVSFVEYQLVANLKRSLRELNDDNITADLQRANTDQRLIALIREQQRDNQSLFNGIIRQQSGRIAVPLHPSKIVMVSFVNETGGILQLLRNYHIRAIVLCSRPEIESYLTGIQAPLKYDIAILKADNNLINSLELLAKEIWKAVNSDALESTDQLPALWLVRDASMEGIRFVQSVKDIFHAESLPERILYDFGLHSDDSYIKHAWIDKTAITNISDDLTLTDSEVDFLITEQKSARLDSLEPTIFLQWLENQIEGHGFAPKYLPELDTLSVAAAELLRTELRSMIAGLAFHKYGLDEVLEEFVQTWVADYNHWHQDLHQLLLSALQQNPTDVWYNKLSRAVRQIQNEYLTSERRRELETIIQQKIENYDL
ncbi:MAG: hypothetical protein Phog2KO_47890 [Phototrophicaceae bacterium]